MVLVTLRYGQFKACDIIRYRTQRLYGLTKLLYDEGFEVELLPSLHWDRLEVIICGRIVFRCRLSYLEYNCEASEDPLAMKAIYTILDSIRNMEVPGRDFIKEGTVKAPAGQVSLIQRNMITIIDACSMLEYIEDSNRVIGIKCLIQPSNIDKSSLKIVNEECKEWKKELPKEDVQVHKLLDTIIETTQVTSQLWADVEPLLKTKCESCSQCIPFCRCSISTISSDSDKETCSVCGPYCICKKVPSSELIKLCRRCGSKTCVCSSSSEGSVEICTIAVNPDETRDDLRNTSNLLCDVCNFINEDLLNLISIKSDSYCEGG